MGLTEIQKTLVAPKSQFNSFGKYKYRNVEDIMEAIKPLLSGEEYVICPTEIIHVGDRYYVQATAIYFDGKKEHKCSAQAREDGTKKGMDLSQLTGATISYARKYALAGLFLCDDTKDADADDKKPEQKEPVKTQSQQQPSKTHKTKVGKLLEIKSNNGRYGAVIDGAVYGTSNPSIILTLCKIETEINVDYFYDELPNGKYELLGIKPHQREAGED